MSQTSEGEGLMDLPILPTTLVGSYAQPDWLIDRARLGERLPPRVRAAELWRIDPGQLEEAQDDATVLALHDQERAGIDILTDGEMRRESYSNRFANALEGVDLDHPGTAIDRTGKEVPVPRVTGEIRRTRTVEADHIAFLKTHTRRPLKITLPGPFTMAQQAQNDHYPDGASLAMGYAEAVNEEVHDLFAAGVDVVQIDEPYLQARSEEARRYAIPAIDRAFKEASGTTALHMCFGYGKHVADKPAGYSFLEELDDCAADQISVECAQPKLDPAILTVLSSKTILFGVLDLRDTTVETPEQVADRIRGGLRHIPVERLVIAPDCGFKYLPRDISFAKLKAMVAGRDIVRAELG
jgi:5-methyltetrahydropteroyltriglutamate--homocysteine methyltransferase